MMKNVTFQGSELLSSVNRIIRAADKHSQVSKRKVVKVITEACCYLKNSCKFTLANKMELLLTMMCSSSYSVRRMRDVMEQAKRIVVSAVRSERKSRAYNRNKYKSNLKNIEL